MNLITFIILLILMGWAFISLYGNRVKEIDSDEDDGEEDLLL
jgi:hypothetical protein